MVLIQMRQKFMETGVINAFKKAKWCFLKESEAVDM